MTTSQLSISAALAVPTRAMRPPSRRTVSPLAKGAPMSPVTMAPRLTTALRMILAFSAWRGCRAVRFRITQAADTGIEPPTARHAENQRDFVRHRGVGQTQADRIVMRADIDIVDAVQRHIDRCAWRADLGDRGNPGGATDHRAERICKHRRQ